MGKRRVVGRIYGMKYCGKGHKDRNRHKNRIKRVGMLGWCMSEHPHHEKVCPWGSLSKEYTTAPSPVKSIINKLNYLQVSIVWSKSHTDTLALALTNIPRRVSQYQIHSLECLASSTQSVVWAIKERVIWKVTIESDFPREFASRTMHF